MTYEHDAPAEQGATYEDGMGGRITILAEGNDDAPLRFRMVLPRGFGPPAPECHPRQREVITVLRGTLDLGTVSGEHVVLQAGESFTLEPGVMHLPANRTDHELEFEATVTPGRTSAEMFARLYDVTREHRGLGQVARQALVFRQHRDVIRFPAPVGVAMAALAGIARAVGLRVYR